MIDGGLTKEMQLPRTEIIKIQGRRTVVSLDYAIEVSGNKSA